jgi:putative DNA primase/helicase
MAKTDFFNPNFKGEVNRIPHLLPILGGEVVDLRSGDTLPRLREHLFTFECPVSMDLPFDTPTPVADKFYSQVMCGDPEMIAFFKRREGYFMTGEMSDRSVWLDWGSGSNMKGTTTAIRAKILSKFAVPLSKDVMIENDKGGGKGAATPHLIPLVNARIGVLSETKEGDKLAGDFLKSLSGNDEIPCRDLYGKQFYFQPQVKLVLQTNHKPEWDVSDQASIDRFKLVPYLARVVAEPTQPNEVKRDLQFVQDLITVHLDEIFR